MHPPLNASNLICSQHPENIVFEMQSLIKQKSQIFHVKDFIKLLDIKQTSNEGMSSYIVLLIFQK